MTINYFYSLGSMDYVTETYAEALKARQYTFKATGSMPTIYRFDADSRIPRYMPVNETVTSILAGKGGSL